MKNKKSTEQVLKVRISKANEVVWEGDALSVSSTNSSGKFDILALHSNFITLVRNDPIVVKEIDGTDKEYIFNQSVIFVTNNVVKIFSNIA